MADWVKTWDTSQVCDWVSRMNMAGKVKAFRTNNVDGPVLLTLDERDLITELGFTAAEAATLIKKLDSWLQVWETTVCKKNVTDLMQNLTVDQVCDWLGHMDLGQHAATVRNHNVDGAVLLTLSKKDLIDELGFPEDAADSLLARRQQWSSFVDNFC